MEQSTRRRQGRAVTALFPSPPKNIAVSQPQTLMIFTFNLTFVKCPCSVFNAKCHYNLYFFNNNNNLSHLSLLGFSLAHIVITISRHQVSSPRTKVVNCRETHNTACLEPKATLTTDINSFEEAHSVPVRQFKCQRIHYSELRNYHYTPPKYNYRMKRSRNNGHNRC